MDAGSVCTALAGLPNFGGAIVVEMPPDWKCAEPTPYTFVFTTAELSASDTRRYVKAMVGCGAVNPRLFTPHALALASLFHPTFWVSLESGRKVNRIPQRLDAAHLLIEPTVDVSSARYFLQSVLFLAGVTLSAAIIQNRWSPGTIGSKLSRLWQAGSLAESVGLTCLRDLGLHEKVRALALRMNTPSTKLLLDLKAIFETALASVVVHHPTTTTTLQATQLSAAERGRFGFVDTLTNLLGSNLEAVIVYGSSVTSNTFADYDLILVVQDAPAALLRLAGSKPTHNGIELNIGVYARSDFWCYQLASGDNLIDHALCLKGAVEVPVKATADLLARNYSFGFIRLRQLLGMAAAACRDKVHTSEDNKANLYEYFLKIPLNIAKGARAAVGYPIDKAAIASWIRSKIGYDLDIMQSWCDAGREGEAIATSAWCTQRTIELLNEERPTYAIAQERTRMTYSNVECRSASSRISVRDRTHEGTISHSLRWQLTQLGFHVVHQDEPVGVQLDIVDDPSKADFQIGAISPNHKLSLMEQCIRCLPINFAAAPLVIEGESKEIRLLTERVVLERLKPTVYSYTENRYGIVAGTEVVRARFSAEIFRRMSRLNSDLPYVPTSAFLGLADTTEGPVLVQRRVDDSNLEIRVKRFHVGSPIHRYRYTERHQTTLSSGPLQLWSRFDNPVVCFDWRHPLRDETGRRCADEPLSDDYAGIWLEDPLYAKEMARATFLWLERLMANADLVLVDMCMFIDRSGRTIFGEISPDCMRVRAKTTKIDGATAFDKDVWRNGSSARTVAARYEAIFDRLFGQASGS